MIVVSDTSVIVNLAWLNHLDLLRELYQQVIIPTAVWDEIVVRGHGKPGSAAVQTADWIELQAPQNKALVKSLLQTVDRGEAEAIALALELDASLLLMDEKLGRATARYFDLNVVGLIGILIRAKRIGLVSSLKPLLDHLRDVAGFYISESLYQQALRSAQE